MTGFYAHHFSVTKAFDGGAYLLSVRRRFTFAAPYEEQRSITAWLTIGCPRNRTRLARLRIQRFDHYTKWHHILLPLIDRNFIAKLGPYQTLGLKVVVQSICRPHIPIRYMYAP